MQQIVKIIFGACLKFGAMDMMSSMNWLEMSFFSVCTAIEVLSTRCDNICLPMKHNFPYDLIVEAKGIFSRIKVLRTDCKAPSGSYVLNIRKSGKDSTHKQHFCPSMCDFIFAVSPIGNYLIPSIEITQKRAISLSMFEKYLIKSDGGA